MKKKRSLLAYCGLYCGACSFRLYYEERERGHLETFLNNYRPIDPDWCDQQEKEPMVEFKCLGCREDPNPDKEDCSIYRCAKSKQLDHCGLCSDFPCQELEDFDNDKQNHHSGVIENLRQVKKMGEDKWIEKMEKEWRCECGSKKSWYLTDCVGCSKEF